ncbi:hypothetical protein DFH09DRAFT_1305048 [Mycena vulgaris]|nr:hypothetical protein DFH09DRAFT_1305048 [Mycena vulgaris]
MAAAAFSPQSSRMPPELLIQVFAYFRPSFSFKNTEDEEVAVGRLRNAGVLTVADVSLRWRTIAVQTPMLWSTIVVLAPSLRMPLNQIEALLSISLQRSGDYPLLIQLKDRALTRVGASALKLLCQHSHRWRIAHLTLPPGSFSSICGIKGNLPLLEELQIIDRTTNTELDAFATVPKLKILSCNSPAVAIPQTIPWAQLKSFEYFRGASVDIPVLFDRLGHLSRRADVDLQLHLNSGDPSLELAPVTSRISGLALHLVCENPAHSQTVLGQIMENITLPCMRQLWLFSGVKMEPFGWPHIQFLSLASRSSFGTTVTFLQLDVVHIPEAELVEVLSVLRVLHTLSVAEDDSGFSPGLISPSLLRSLIWTLDARFLARIQWVSGRKHEFSKELRGKLAQPVIDGILQFVVD